MKEKGRKQFSPHIECITYERKINKLKSLHSQHLFCISYVWKTRQGERDISSKKRMCVKNTMRIVSFSKMFKTTEK